MSGRGVGDLLIRTSDKVLFSGIVFVLVFTQLAFGGVHVWAYTVFEITVFLLFLLFFGNHVLSQYRSSKGLREKAGISLQWVISPLNIFFVLIISLIVIQLIPLPPFIVKFVSPHTFEIKKNVYELTSASSNGANAWMNLSLYNYATYKELIKVLSYAALYFIIINTVRDRNRIKILIYVLVVMGLFQVFYGIAQTYSSSQKIWWWTNNYYGGWVTGTYINRNHLGGFLEMVIPLCTGLMIASIKTSRKAGGSPDEGAGRREKDRIIWKSKIVRRRSKSGARDQEDSISKLKRFRNWISSGEERSKIILLIFMGIPLGLGLLLTGSRGGIISFGICMFFMALLFMFKSGYRKYGIVAICLCFIILGYGLYVGIEKTVKRFEHLENLYGRLEIAKSVIPMIHDFPLLGIGWGNFKYMYPRYAPSEYSGPVSVGYAHNDWVEMTAESGMVGASLFLFALLVYLIRTTRLWFRRSDNFAIGIGAGAIAAVISISIHSFFDFNMHIPANPMALSSILAIGFLSTHIERHSTYDRFFYKTKSVSVNGKGPMVLLVALVLLVGFFLFQRVTGHFVAEAYCSTVWNSSLNRDRKPPLWEIKRAIEYDPSNAQYHDELARYYMRLPVRSKELRSKINEEIIKNLEKAVSLNSGNGLYWYDLGLRYSYKVYEGTEYFGKWLPKADKAFELADYFRPNDAYMLYNIGWYWVWRSSVLPMAEGSRRKAQGASEWSVVSGQWSVVREEGVKKFQGLFRRALEINEGYWKKAVERVWRYYPDERIVMGIVPDGDRDLGKRVEKWICAQK